MRSRDPLMSLRATLEDLHARYHRPEFIRSDPLAFVHAFRDPGDREIVGLIAASLAYGNVKTIHASIRSVLERLEHRPRDVLLSSPDRVLRRALRGFRHRWTDARSMESLLAGIRNAVLEHGTLGQAFYAVDTGDPDVRGPLAAWVRRLTPRRDPPVRNLLADPEAGSACKRLFLFLRWMARHDDIDPGGWPGLSPARLKVPLDTHMFAFARAHRMTRRTSADARAVDEITAVFRRICPEDPVRYDFALTRPGILRQPGAAPSAWA